MKKLNDNRFSSQKRELKKLILRKIKKSFFNDRRPIFKTLMVVILAIKR